MMYVVSGYLGNFYVLLTHLSMFATQSLNLNTENADAILGILIVYEWKVFLIERILVFPYQVCEGIVNFHYSHLKI